jgi:hypothetical protein
MPWLTAVAPATAVAEYGKNASTKLFKLASYVLYAALTNFVYC